jgi:hypothetical protein
MILKDIGISLVKLAESPKAKSWVINSKTDKPFYPPAVVTKSIMKNEKSPVIYKTFSPKQMYGNLTAGRMQSVTRSQYTKLKPLS